LELTGGAGEDWRGGRSISVAEEGLWWWYQG